MADNYEIDVTLEEIFGTGISSVEQTVESHEPNGVNEVTVTLTNGQTSVFNVRNGDSSGKPTPVATVAEMTDPTEIYLYTGSEEGYVKGNIYCYKNNEWTDVGTYGGMLVDEELDADSENAVANKAITEAINATPQLRIVENGKWVVAVPDHDNSSASVYVPTVVSMGHPDLLQTDTKSSLVDAVNEVKADTNALIAAVGSPLVANTAAGMTDHTKIYVYTGSETGYTSGHWYYFDGSAWADGGIYQSTGIDTDKTLTVPNQAADGKAVGDEISDLKSAIQRGSGLTAEVKQALMDIFEHIGGLYTDANARTYIGNLRTALYPPTNLDSISAVYTQSGTVYASDSLNSLKADLVVTAHYSDLTTETITTYALSGTLTVGTSTITVTYGGKSTTFTVTVTSAAHGIPSDYQEVEWVKNELNSVGIWTDARNLPTAFRLEAKAQLHGYNSGGTYGNIVAVFQRGAQTYGYELAYRQATSDLTSFLGNQSNITPSDLNAVIVVGTVCNGATEQAYMVVDGERVYGDSVEVSRTYNNNGIGLFYGGATVKNQLVGRIYYVNVYDSSEELYAQFIPCYRKSDGAIGFYENVTGTFVTESTANLSKGADVL